MVRGMAFGLAVCLCAGLTGQAFGQRQYKLLYAFQGGTVDGSDPDGDPIGVGNRLYGTTVFDGAGSDGIAFAFNPKTGKETILHSRIDW